MDVTKRIYSVVVIIALVVFFIPRIAYAETPSESLQNQINNLNTRIQQNQDMQNTIQNKMAHFANEKDSTAQEKSEAQDRWDKVYKEFENDRPEVEEAVKNNYALFFAKDFIKDVIGSEVVADALFRWNLLMLFADNEHKLLHDKIEYYYNEYDEYNKVVNKDKLANEQYNKAITDKANLESEAQNLNNELALKTKLQPQIVDIESKYGEACAAWIVAHGMFSHPCPNAKLSSLFDEVRKGKLHKGIDFSASEGTDIFCAYDGRVTETNHIDRDSGGRGFYVKVEHADGLVTIYMHCSEICVNVGDEVKKGQKLALVGSTGDSTGPHLHFQTEIDGNPVNGIAFLQS
ncbi:MAG: peptidoglycan DD-metalloendopeptidase family protein [Coriobacteriia bacterium]|nr:peptidoglycan DD-metalloendopeptidase family protein [Coriobacteriia bacterium]